MKQQTLTSYLKLLACEGIGVYNAHKLLDIFKDVEAIFDPDKRDFFDQFDVNASIQKIIKHFDKDDLVKNEIEFIKDNGIKWVGFLDEEYPKILKECVDAPIVLFYKGDLSLLDKRAYRSFATIQTYYC